MGSPGRQSEWALRAQANETPLGIEDVEQGKEVARIGPPAVNEERGRPRDHPRPVERDAE